MVLMRLTWAEPRIAHLVEFACSGAAHAAFSWLLAVAAAAPGNRPGGWLSEAE